MSRLIESCLIARAIRLPNQSIGEYLSLAAASTAVAKRRGVGAYLCAAGLFKPKSTMVNSE